MPESSHAPDSPATTPWHWVVPALFVGVGLLRVAECAALPVSSNDISRHIYTGLMVVAEGPGSLAMALGEWRPSLAGAVPWPELPYNYPSLAVLLSTAVAAIWPSLFFFKLTLTAMEAINAWLVHRVTGERLLALVYWASPISVFWVSREGQFEPLQNLFVLLALVCLKARPAWAPAMLVLGVQAKLSAVLLVPWFVWQWLKLDRAVRVRSAVFAAVALLPTVVLAMATPSVLGVYAVRFPVDFNLWYFNPFDKSVTHDAPAYLLAWNAITSTVFLGILVYFAARRRNVLPYLTAIVFLLLARLTPHFLFWYFLVLPTLLLTIEDARERRWLFVAVVVLEISGTLGMVMAWVGYVQPLGVFDGLLSWDSLQVPTR